MSNEIRSETHDLRPHIRVNIVSEQEAIAVGLNPATYVGKPGVPPKIGEDDYWYVWNNATQEWENTGVYARGGISSYDSLANKPQINSVELVGNRTARQLGLENRIVNSEIEELFKED